MEMKELGTVGELLIASRKDRTPGWIRWASALNSTDRTVHPDDAHEVALNDFRACDYRLTAHINPRVAEKACTAFVGTRLGKTASHFYAMVFLALMNEGDFHSAVRAWENKTWAPGEIRKMRLSDKMGIIYAGRDVGRRVANEFRRDRKIDGAWPVPPHADCLEIFEVATNEAVRVICLNLGYTSHA